MKHGFMSGYVVEDLRGSVSFLSTTRIARSSSSSTDLCSRMIWSICLADSHGLHEYGANTFAAYFLSKKFLMRIMMVVILHENQMAVARGRKRCM